MPVVQSSVTVTSAPNVNACLDTPLTAACATARLRRNLTRQHCLALTDATTTPENGLACCSRHPNPRQYQSGAPPEGEHARPTHTPTAHTQTRCQQRLVRVVGHVQRLGGSAGTGVASVRALVRVAVRLGANLQLALGLGNVLRLACSPGHENTETAQMSLMVRSRNSKTRDYRCRLGYKASAKADPNDTTATATIAIGSTAKGRTLPRLQHRLLQRTAV